MKQCLGLDVVIDPVAEDEPTQEAMAPRQAEERNRWQSCCFEVDKRVVLFGAQLFVSTYIASFCMYQLVTLKNCEAQTLYTGILTFTIGLYFPNPRMN